MNNKHNEPQISLLKKWLAPLAAILGLILMVAWMAGSFREKIEPGLDVTAASNLSNAIAVEAELMEKFEPVPASIAARVTTVISSRVLARITQISVSAGDQVSQGQMLVALENDDFQSQVQQARSRINSLEARLVEARSDLERSVQLRSTGVLSQSDLDRARANHDSLAAELDAANQALDQAETLLGYTRILSPIEGLVVDRFAEPGDTASPSMQILTLYNPMTLRVEAQVRETLALGLQQGQNLQVEIPSLGQTLDAIIEERVPAADPGSRSFLIKARLEENPRLQPGMYARLMIPASIEKHLWVPSDRVAEIGQMRLVWVASSEGIVERRFVRTGADLGAGRVQITSGLTEGELILPLPQEVAAP